LKTTDSPKQTQFVVALLMLAFSVMSYFNRTIMSISGPEIIKEFSLSETQMGSIYSAFILSYALLMIPGGHLADRFGPRIVVAFMGLGSALFTGLTAVAGNPVLGSWIGVVPSFLLVRLAMGASTAPLYPSCARMNANWFPLSQRARIWGLIAAGAGIGGAVSPLLFAAMINRFGWRISFWVSAGVTALLSLVWLRKVRDRPIDSTHTFTQEPTELAAQSMNPAKAWWKERNLVLLTAGYFTVGYFEYIFFFWIYYYFGEIRKMGKNETAIYTTILFLMWTVMTPPWRICFRSAC
jgi:MFS family permease